MFRANIARKKKEVLHFPQKNAVKQKNIFTPTMNKLTLFSVFLEANLKELK